MEPPGAPPGELAFDVCRHRPSSRSREHLPAADRWRIRRRRGQLELRVLGHHALEADADALDDGDEDCTPDRTVAHLAQAAADGEGAAGKEAGDDRVPGVFFASVVGS